MREITAEKVEIPPLNVIVIALPHLILDRIAIYLELNSSVIMLFKTF